MGLADRSGFLVPADRPDLTRRLLRSVLEHLAPWDLLHLKAVPADGDLALALEAGTLAEGDLASAGLRLRIVPHDTSPFVPCEGTWDEYLASRSKSFRKALRKRRNRLSKLEGFRIDRFTGEDCVRELPTIFRLSERSWKGETGTALAASAPVRDFLVDLARALAHREGLVLHVLRLDHGPVAYELCLRGPRSLVAYDAAYDSAYARWSPGSILSGFILEGAFTDKLLEYDQSRGPHAYKLHWSNHLREESQFVVTRAGLRSAAGWLGEIGLRRFARRVPGIAGLHDRVARWRNEK